LQSLLTTELIVVTAQLPLEEALNYDVVKSKLLERFQLTTDADENRRSGREISCKARQDANTQVVEGINEIESFP
jgi:hypothetical protein